MDVSTALAGISHGIAVLKALKDATDASSDTSVKMQIAELTAAFADAKVALAEVRSMVDEKEKEISNLRAQLKRRDDAVELRGLLYPTGPDGEADGLPYCPRCIEVDGYLILCQIKQGTGGTVFCPHCKTRYPISLHAPLPPR